MNVKRQNQYRFGKFEGLVAKYKVILDLKNESLQMINIAYFDQIS